MMDEKGNDQSKQKTKLNSDGDSDDMSVDDPLVSIVKQPQPPADKDILAALYPIVFNVEPYDSMTSLILALMTKSFFRVRELATSEEHLKTIKGTLWKIYCDVREREIDAKLEISGDNEAMLRMILLDGCWGSNANSWRPSMSSLIIILLIFVKVHSAFFSNVFSFIVMISWIDPPNIR